MFVARLSLTPLKGTAHVQHSWLRVDAEGLRADRRFCLVDPLRRRVLRTVENPALMGWRATVDGDVLSVRLPSGIVSDVVVTEGKPFEVDYWGRTAHVRALAGPWATRLSAELGRPVLLGEVTSPGQVVFGGAVTVLTTSSLRELARRLGTPGADHAERFRSTVVVDTGDAEPFVEDTWPGRRLALGDAVVTVTGAVPRCAVVRIEPGVGRVGRLDPLRALAADRTETNERGREVVFGVQGDVERPGTVHLADPVTLS